MESWNGVYNVETWHKQYALASFSYDYKFNDDNKTEMKTTGKVVVVFNDKGQLSKWMYFSKDASQQGSHLRFVNKLGQMAQEYIQQHDGKQNDKQDL